MPDFDYNSIEDLVFNQSFRAWVLNKNADSFWDDWAAKHPEKKAMVNHAKAIIYALQPSFKNLSEIEIQEEIQKALSRLTEEETNAFYFHPASHFTVKIFQSAASKIAVAIILMAVAVLFFLKEKENNTSPSVTAYEKFLKQAGSERIEQSAATTERKDLQLPDGSKVYLKPGSKLSYTKEFTGKSREVYLTGEAFFEVSRDPANPFIVYTNSIITKVLGTSFWVNAADTGKMATVTVKTGKVSVFRTTAFSDEGKEPNLDGGMVVTPNHSLVYNAENNQLTKRLTPDPQPLAGEPGKKAFAFHATPIGTVFKTLQETYGITMIYDEETLAGCSITATLGSESFYDKLEIICKAIHATYETIDGNVVITSRGCN